MATIPTVNDGDFATDVWPDAVTTRLNGGTALYDGATSQAIATGIGTLTDLTFATSQVTSDPSGAFVDASDAIKILEAGVYLVTAYIGWANNATGDRRAAIKLNGTATWHDLRVGSLAQPNGHNLVIMAQFALNDLISLAAAQSSGGNLNVTSKLLAVKRMW